MHAWAVVENGALLVRIEKPTPEPTGTEVLIEVTHCGVCHSDLHLWDGYYELGGGKRFMLAERGVTLPRAIGHEILGRVAKLGPEGEDNLCASQRSLGVMQDGEYDASLRQRGSLTVWFTDEAIAAWRAEPRTTRGGQRHYSTLAILTALTLRAVFRLALRQTEGLIGSIIHLLGLALAVPDHSTLSRRAETLQMPGPRPGRDGEPVHLLVDSTGLKSSCRHRWRCGDEPGRYPGCRPAARCAAAKDRRPA